LRKHLIWVVAVIAALGVSSIAIAATVHSVKAKVAPAKQKKRVYGPASLDFTTQSTCDESDSCKLNPANRVRVYIDDDIKVNGRGLPSCDPDSLENTTTAQARAKCKSSMVGKGTSVAFIAGQKNAPANGTGTGFNGPKQGGRPTLIVHNYVPVLDRTVVLVGALKPGTGDFGTILDVNVPPLQFGTALAKFQLKLQRSFRFKGKTRHYLTARCFDNNRTWNFKGRDDYGGGDPPKTATAKQRCQVRN
jgi:hypothetical protein